jgi:hypothetical protein
MVLGQEDASCPFGEADATLLAGNRFHNYDIASFDDIQAEVRYCGLMRRRRAVVACDKLK